MQPQISLLGAAALGQNKLPFPTWSPRDHSRNSDDVAARFFRKLAALEKVGEQRLSLRRENVAGLSELDFSVLHANGSNPARTCSFSAHQAELVIARALRSR
jgi:hypothetical protein